MGRKITFTDRLHRDITATDLGRRTIRSLKVGDYVMATSHYDGATDWRRVVKIGELEPATLSRGRYRRVQLESVAYGWDDRGAYRPAPRFHTVLAYTTGDDFRVARPIQGV